MRTYLKDLRKKAGLNQTQVAKALGMVQTNYSAIESGKTKTMPSKIMKALSDLYKVRIDNIMQAEYMYSLHQQ